LSTDIAAPELTVDGEIEHGEIACSALAVDQKSPGGTAHAAHATSCGPSPAWPGAVCAFLGCAQKTGRLAMASLPCRSWRASDAQRPVNDLSGDNYVRAVGGNSFFSSRSRAILPFG
jgi:hypothetical protein